MNQLYEVAKFAGSTKRQRSALRLPIASMSIQHPNALKPYMYISVIDTLRELFKNPDVRDLIHHDYQGLVLLDFNEFQFSISLIFFCSEIRNPSAFTSLREGQNFRSEQGFYVLRIELFYDDFGVNSPIGHASSRGKIAGFYFTLNNLPYYVQSKRRNIMICLFALRSTVERIGLMQILQPFYEEMNQLRAGMDLGLALPVKAYVCAVVGDNLATNELARVSRNFTTDACKYCNITYNMLQDPETSLQIPSSDNRILARRYNPNGLPHALSPINSLHMPYTFDLFHDLHEGCIKEFVNLFLKITCSSLPKLTSFLKQMQQIVSRDPGIKLPVPGKDLKVYGKGMQIYECFLHLGHFELITGERREDQPEYHLLRAYNALRKIVCFAQSEIIYPSIGLLFKNQVRQYIIHMRTLSNLMDDPISVKFKMHFLLHYTEMVNFFGPIKRFSTIRFERVHKLSKDIMSTSNNTINIPYTLANRYLDNLNFYDMMPKLKYETWATFPANEIQGRINDLFVPFLDPNFDLNWVSKCTLRGIVFKPDDFFAIKKGNSFQIVYCDSIFIQKNPQQPDQEEIVSIMCFLTKIVRQDVNHLSFEVVRLNRAYRLDLDDLYIPRSLYHHDNLVINDFYFECPQNVLVS